MILHIDQTKKRALLSSLQREGNALAVSVQFGNFFPFHVPCPPLNPLHVSGWAICLIFKRYLKFSRGWNHVNYSKFRPDERCRVCGNRALVFFKHCKNRLRQYLSMEICHGHYWQVVAIVILIHKSVIPSSFFLRFINCQQWTDRGKNGCQPD